MRTQRETIRGISPLNGIAPRRPPSVAFADPDPTSMSSAKKQKVSAEERVFLFSSESVNEGHPDKLADQVSDAVLDACLTEDPMSKVRSRRRVGLCSARGAPVHGRSRLVRTPPHLRMAPAPF